MRFDNRLIYMALMAAAATPAWGQSNEADALAASGEIVLYQSSDRVLVMMRIRDGELTPMVFDTGSDGNSIDASLARRLRLKRVGTVHEIDGTSGKERFLPNVRVHDVTLGGLKVGQIDATATPYDRNDAMGIISTELFTDSLMYLDLANQRALLTPRLGSPAPVGDPIAYIDGLPTVHIKMPDGSTLPAHFDTGYNAALSLPLAMLDKVPLMAPARVIGRFKSISAEGDVLGGRIKGTIKIGPLILNNPEVAFLGTITNIGLPIIRQITLVIDAAADRNWVLPAGSRPSQPALSGTTAASAR